MDWLDEQEFYEVCQTYRHSKDYGPFFDGQLNAVQAFEALKTFIRGESAAKELARMREAIKRIQYRTCTNVQPVGDSACDCCQHHWHYIAALSEPMNEHVHTDRG